MSVEHEINKLLEQAQEMEQANNEEVLGLTEEDLDLLSDDEINSLVENQEQLDELSKQTLVRYVHKANDKRLDAAKDITSLNHDLDKAKEMSFNGNPYIRKSAESMKDELNKTKSILKATDRKRELGSYKALKRLTKEDLDASEETRIAKGKINSKDENENQSKTKLATGPESKDYNIKKDISFDKGDQTEFFEELDIEDLDQYSLEELQDFMQTEDFEQLDELSKQKLGRYITKAADDMAMRYGLERESLYKKKNLHRHADELNLSPEDTDKVLKAHNVDRSTLNKLSKKIGKRYSGIASATSRLTKEDLDPIDLGNLFEGHDLTEDFKTKATTIFESAVATRVAQELAMREEELAEFVSEEMDELTEGLIDKVDGFLGYIAEQWLQKNELALDRGIKAEMFESFVSGMKNLFTEHYINVPEEQIDALDELHSEKEELEQKLNETTEHNIVLSNTLRDISKQMQIEEAIEGLSDVQAEKFMKLAENIVFEDEDTFSEKLEVIRENYFSAPEKSAPKQLFMSDAPVESLTEEVSPVAVDSTVATYAKFIK